mgnify:CR=1 FL=1
MFLNLFNFQSVGPWSKKKNGVEGLKFLLEILRKLRRVKTGGPPPPRNWSVNHL